MRLGLAVTNFNGSQAERSQAATFARVVREADQAGVHALWIMDHFHQLPMYGNAEDPIPEPYAALSFAAAHTERAMLGTLVTCVTHRHPSVLIKAVTTLDMLSEGRAYLGIGVGASEREHRAMGLPIHSTADRFEMLEETLRIARHLWAGSQDPYTGKHFRLEAPILTPRPVQAPHPPVLIGGGGERQTLRLVALYGDACNFLDLRDDSLIPRKLAVLQRHCAEAGRDYAEIERTLYTDTRLGAGGGRQPTAAMAERLHAWAEAGIDQVIVGVLDIAEPGVTDSLADLVARAGQFVPAGRRSAAAGAGDRGVSPR